jgi:hypothetical protein
VIEPDVTGFRYDDFERSAELVELGKVATRAALPEIRKWLEPAVAPKRARAKVQMTSPLLNSAAE